MGRNQVETASSTNSNESQSVCFEVKTKLSETQEKTIKKNCKEIMEDKPLMCSLLDFLNQGIDSQFNNLKSPKKVVVAGAYLLVDQFWRLNKKAFVGFQNEKQEKIINTLKSEAFNGHLQEALNKCKKAVLRQLFKLAEVWVKIDDFELEVDAEEGDEVIIYRPFGGGVAAIAKAIVLKIDERDVSFKKVQFLHDFYKEPITTISLDNVKVKTKAKDLSPSRNSFSSITRGTRILSTNAKCSSNQPSDFSNINVQSSTSSEASISATVSRTSCSNSDKQLGSDIGSDEQSSNSSPPTIQIPSLNKPEVNLTNPAFLKHYDELVKENSTMKLELARYKRAVRNMNEMIAQMVKCLDEYEDIFELGDSTVTHGDNVVVLTNKERAKICELGEKTSQIMHVCTTYIRKSIVEVDKAEKILILKIIFDAIGLNMEKHCDKLKSYKGVFRTIKSKMKNSLDSSNKKKKKKASKKRTREEESESDYDSSYDSNDD